MLKYWKHLAAAFAVCLVLVLLTQPAEAAGGQQGAFTYTLKGNGTAVITKFDWSKHSGGDVYVPRMIDGYWVTEIGYRAFSEAEYTLEIATKGDFDERITASPLGQIVSIILPDTITRIGDEAFYATRITNCTIPTSVKSIGKGAFAFCPEIREFSVISGNPVYTTIDGILYNKQTKELVAFPPRCEHKTVTIPEGIQSIGPYAFYCVGRETVNYWDVTCYIEEIILPSTIKELKEYSFYGADIPKISGSLTSLSSIGTYVFQHADINIACTYAPLRIDDYAFGYFEGAYGTFTWNRVEYLGVGAFYRAEYSNTLMNLSAIKVDTIPAYAFWGLRDQWGRAKPVLTLPEGLKEIGPDAFLVATWVDSGFFSRPGTVNIPSSVEIIHAKAFTGSWYVSFSENSSLRIVEDFAFKSVNNQSLELPSSLVSLGSGAFDSNYLEVLVIPDSVTEIGTDVVRKNRTKLRVNPGSYAEFWALENGYTLDQEDDTSWLFE